MKQFYNNENKIKGDALIQRWMEKEVAASDADIDEEVKQRMFAQIKKQTIGTTVSDRKSVAGVWKWVAVICIPICLALSGYLWLNYYPKSNAAPLWVQVAKGDKAHITLPDGTDIMLNSASCLSYPSDFGGEERCVYLQGEAFMQVAHDDKRPFRVHTTGLDVQVLGTSFNLTAYDEDVEVTVVLLKGSVDVKTQTGSQLMVPGDKVAYNKRSGELVATQVQSRDYIEWTKGNLYFEKESLKNIMQTLSRMYNVDIEFETEDLKEDTFSGTIPGGDIQSILEILRLTANFDFELVGSKLTIRGVDVNKD